MNSLRHAVPPSKKFAGCSNQNYLEALRIINQEWPQNREELVREDWDQVHMRMAFEAAKRSSDAQTKVGAFLTNENHEPVSAGYNGFPRGAMDDLMPNKRPSPDALSQLYGKYPWMTHAELNTILNAARQGKSTVGTILYCTHRPCLPCLMSCWQAGCHHVVVAGGTITNMSSNDETSVSLAIFDLITGGQMTLREIDFQKD